jgi:Ran GTPase-activating protein (RanGAP) involved in mRNA processing and transport
VSLKLPMNYLKDEGCEFIARCTYLKHLKSLDLSSNMITHVGVLELSKSEIF